MEINSYDLELDIDYKNMTYRGKEKIRLTLDGEQLIINALDLQVSQVRVQGKAVSFSHDNSHEELKIEGTSRGKNEIDIDFTGKVNDALVGLYKAKAKSGTMLTTQFESTGARRMFPCLDNPGFKAEFSLTVIIDGDLEAISNMPVESETRNGSRKAVRFAKTPRMSTYLLYLGVGKFDSMIKKSGNVDFILTAPKGHLNTTEFPLEVAIKVVDFYQKYFNIKYALPKMHLIAVPEFAAGAMENWGAITYRESVLLVNESTSTAVKKRVAEVIAHEIAHQWFGDLVTMRWWNDLWLNESFATFMSFKTIDNLFPKWEMFGDFLISETEGALTGDSLHNSHPIDVDVKDPTSVAMIFDEISYGKGGSILRMIESYAGPDNFRDGIRAYLKEKSYGNAEGHDLWQSIEKISRLPVTKIMEAWIKKMGYPAIHASKSGNVMTLEQGQFFLNGAKSETIWPVPLTVVRDGKTDSVLFESRKMELPYSGFVKLNSNQTGFYRVNYSNELFKDVMSKSGKLSNLDRWGILNDQYALLMSGIIKLDDYITRIRGFFNDTNHLIVDEISGDLNQLHLIMPENEKIRAIAEEYTRAQVNRLGEKKTGEDENTSVLRGQLWQRLALVDGKWAKETSARFKGFLKVDPDIRTGVAFSAALTLNSISDIETVFRKMESDEDRMKLISAMGFLSGEKNTGRVMQLVTSGDIKKQDIMRFFVAAAMNPANRKFMFDTLPMAVEELRKVYAGTAYTSRMVEAIVPYIGIGREEETQSLLKKLSSADIELGTKKGLEYLEAYSALVKSIGK
ncbi:Tricorn protease-interacting factor F2 [Thermoplasmatales archaeon]|nr:Tricorn protease-interacting factor F2 [Thermoplasmatales archaeon]